MLLRKTIDNATQKHLIDAELLYVLVPKKDQKHKETLKNMILTMDNETKGVIHAIKKQAIYVINNENNQ